MDENLQKAIQDCAESAERLGTALYEGACEAAQRLQAILSESMEDLNAALSSISAAFGEIIALAFDRTEARRNERMHWSRPSSVRLPALFLDRRKVVHHCRNTC